MTSYFIDVRFERQLDDDLPVIGLTDEQAKNGKILGGHLVRQFVGELLESYNYGGLAGHFEVERVVLSSGDDIWRHGDPLPPYTLEEAVTELVPELDKVKQDLPEEVQFRLARCWRCCRPLRLPRRLKPRPAKPSRWWISRRSGGSRLPIWQS